MNKNSKNKKTSKKLEDKFQQLGKGTKMPEDLKEEVFSTLDSITLFADIVDLFTTKFSMTEVEVIGMATEEIKTETIDKKEADDKTEEQPKKDK